MLSVDPAALGRLNTKSIQQKMDEKAKLLASFLFLFLELCVGIMGRTVKI